MAPLSNHVSLTITQDSVGIARAGFGVPLILSATAAFVERSREYSSLAEVAADFAVTTSPEYLAAQALFSQNPKPEKIRIGRSALPPTQKYTVAATARNSHAYSIGVHGAGMTADDAEYTSDAASSVGEVHTGMVAALNALSGNIYLAALAALVVADVTFTTTHAAETLTINTHGLLTGDGPVQLTTSAADLPDGLLTGTDYYVIKVDDNTIKLATSRALAFAGTNVTFDDDGSGTHTLVDTASTARPSDPFTVTADAAGGWFNLEANVDDFSIKQTHTDPGVATDLAAIALANNDWYALITLYNSNAYVLAAAAWVQSNKKLYIVDVNETEAVTTAVTNSDTLDDLHTLGYSRTAGMYHHALDQMPAAAWAGKVLPTDPGSESWKFHALAGVAATTLTSTQRSNLIARSANGVEVVAGAEVTYEGTTTDGDFIDVIRGLDWIEDDMAKGVFGALVSAAAAGSKIPFTDDGIAVIEAQMRATLRRAVKRGILARTPEPTVTVPKAADISTADKAARRLPDCKFTGTLAGAVHKVILSGVVSV